MSGAGRAYSVLLAGSQSRLAPLYDIASVPYPQLDSDKAKLAMKAGTRYLMRDIVGRHWVSLAADLAIDPDAYLERIGTMAGDLTAALAEAAADPTVAGLGSDLPARLIHTVAEHVVRCRRQLAMT